MNLTIAILGIYLLICLGLAFHGWSKRSETLEDFFLRKRDTGVFIAIMTFSATLFSSFMLVGMPGFFYTHGIGSLAFVIFADILMAVLIFYLGNKLWTIAKRNNILTPTEFIEKRYNSKFAMIIALTISFVFLLPYISTQIIGVGIILGSFIKISPMILSLFIVGIIFLYSEMGGMRTVTWTDALQGGLLIIISIVIMFGIIGHFGGLESFFGQVEATDANLLSLPGPTGLFTIPMLISYFLMIFLMPITQPQLTMRYLIPKNRKVLKSMLIATPIIAFLAIVPTMFIGFGAKIIDPSLPSGDLALNTVLGIFPEIIVALAVIGVIAASMSTADSQILALSSLITKDLVKSKNKMMIARLSILAISILAYLIAMNPPKLIVTLSVLSFAGTLQIAPAMIGGLYWKRGTSHGAIWSMVLGTSVLVMFQWFIKSPLGFHAAFWAFLVSIAVYVGVSLMTKEDASRLK
ncbi:sodium:solute symporter family protein [Candidatus Woesearchaeota archaeon]|nr:sodium:solute symporter family protein [Candidatus Woesearchaeota archaeon]